MRRWIAVVSLFMALAVPAAAAPVLLMNAAQWWRNTATLDLDFEHDRYWFNGTEYAGIAGFTGAAGVSFTRASTATYFDAGGVMQVAAAHAPRLDYGPEGGAYPKGILIEDARSNYVPNSMMAGAAAGSPGTLPTYWTQYLPAGLSLSVAGTGSFRGMAYIDVRIAGTPQATGNYSLHMMSSLLPAAATGQPWAGTAYTALVAGSAANWGASLNLSENNASKQWLGNSIIALNRTGTLAKVTVRRVFSLADTAYASLYFNLSFTNALAVDFTLRIAAPQLEAGVFTTSFIPTSGGAAARGADLLNLSLPEAWFNSAEGTVLARASFPKSSALDGRRHIWIVNDSGGSSNRLALRSANTGDDTGGTFPHGVVWSGASMEAPGVYPGDVFITSAFSYSNSASPGAALSVDGQAVASAAAGVVPTIAQGFTIGGGASHAISQPMCGHISRFTYFPARQPNYTLPDYSR